MIDKIAVLCPTRGRPEKSRGAYESWFECNSGLSEFWFVLDEDDAPSYPRLEGCRYIEVPRGRRGMTDSLNAAAVRLKDEYRYLMFIGDDHRFRTPDWDARFIQALDEMGPVSFVYGNDLYQGSRIPTEVAMTSEVVRRLGYMANPLFQHYFVDDYWLALGRGIGKIRYLEDVVVEHMHHEVGKTDRDACYRSLEAYNPMTGTRLIDDDCRRFAVWRDTQMAEEIEKLQ